jgi:hypothetical protein
VPNILGNVLQPDIFQVLKYDQRGAMFVGSEAEPHIAVDPANPDNISIAWMQDRAARLGGGLGLIVASTTNGGTTWVRTIVPFSRASGAPDISDPGSYDRVSDPWLAFDKNGPFYFQALAFDGLSKDVGGAITVAKLAKGAAAFGPVNTIYAKSGIGNRTTDKPTFVADPTRAGPNGDPILYATFAIFDHSGKNDIYFSMSADAGQNWATNKIYTAESAADPGSKDKSNVLGEIAVLPNGTLAFVFTQADGNNFESSNSFALRLIRSFDGGATWEKTPVELARLTPTIIFDPEINDKSGARIPIRGSDSTLPALSINATSGDLYVAYSDAIGGIKGTTSSVKIVRLSNLESMSQAPAISAPVTVADKNAFLPVIEVASNGTVGIGFADMKNDVQVPGCGYNTGTDTNNCGPLSADFWLKQFTPDLTREINITRLTETSIDYRAAPLLFGAGGVIPGGLFLGDYIGLTSAGNKFMAAFPNTTTTSSTLCELTMNDAGTGLLVTKKVAPLYLPDSPNAIAINKCNRNDIFFTSVPVAQ